MPATGHDDKFTTELMQDIASMTEDMLSGIQPPLGFCILVYPFGGSGIGNYISNSSRDDMIKALRETAGRLERHEDNVSS
jgi:hypothetical protein